ncbi:hypothetical protein [uncultured Oscillibacter sp.]|uniref:hypothetical protein n=1 Tax=uncultured Oscillibacter sp. TaxID=876091 RepID=UPI0025FCF3A2|nr:hypothetical protein [uncultured Oscillibacter sp.]
MALCCGAGLLNGKSAEAFDPQGLLNGAELMVLTDRLYQWRTRGTAQTPPLPEDPNDAVRFYDGDRQVAHPGDVRPIGYGPHQLTLRFVRETYSPGQPSLRLELGEPGRPAALSATGVLIPEESIYEYMDEAPETGALTTQTLLTDFYRFDLGEAVSGGEVAERLAWYDGRVASRWRDWQADGTLDQWWFPAVYGLVYRSGLEPLSTAHMDDAETSTDTPAAREDFAAALWSVCPDLEAVNCLDAVPDMAPAEDPPALQAQSGGRAGPVQRRDSHRRGPGGPLRPQRPPSPGDRPP